MISTSGAAPRALLDGLRGARDRAHLHLVDLRPLDAEPAAARPEHRVRLVQRLDPLAHALVGRVLEIREELVQRRVEQPDRRPAGPPSPRRCPRSRTAGTGAAGRAPSRRPVLVGGEDHLLHDREPLLAEEHVLGAAEADPLGAELARLRGVLGRVGVRAHLAGGAPRRPSRGCVSKSSLICGGTSSTSPTMTRPVPPSIVIMSPSRRSWSPMRSVARPACRSRAPRSRRRTACPCRARRRPRARSCRRAR